MTLIEQLIEKEKFTEGECVLANYIINNLETVSSFSIRELSQKTYTSTATVFRLCRKLGLNGYREFVIRLSREIESHYSKSIGIDVNFPFNLNDSDILIAKKIATLSQEVIVQAHSLLTESVLNQAVDMIIEADSILGIGVSHSFNYILDFQTKMLRINYYVKLIQLQSDQFHLANNATQNDVALIISYSGTTAEIINDARLLKQKKCKVIAITSNMNGELASYVDLILPLPKDENGALNISTFSSQIATEFILNVLYSCIYQRNYLKNIAKNKNAPTSFLSS